MQALRSGDINLQQVLRELALCIESYFIRFNGAYTDGGMDQNSAYYWIDNMFVPNNWTFHCRCAVRRPVADPCW
jgi:hypothetical protein